MGFIQHVCAGAVFAHPCEKSVLSKRHCLKYGIAIIKCNLPIKVGVEARKSKSEKIGTEKIGTSAPTLKGKFHLAAVRDKTKREHFEK